MATDSNDRSGSRPRRNAVALAYEGIAAPRVTATGDGELAEAILREAEAQGVFVTRDPALAAALSQLRLDEEIPEELFTAVAIILSWAYWLRGLTPPGAEKPEP